MFYKNSNQTCINVFTFLLIIIKIHLSASIKVIIIGAGASGIAAATELNANGVTTKILEGRDRIGGRISTDFNSFGYPIDLGAIHITHQADNPLLKFAEKNKVRQIPIDHGNNLYLNQNGEEIKNAYSRIHKIKVQFLSFVKTNYEEYKTKSIQYVLDSFKKKFKLNFFDSIAIDSVSSGFNMSILRPLNDVKHYFFTGATGFNDSKLTMTPEGYIAILKPEADKLDIQFNTIIKSTSQDGDKVTVTDDLGITYTADYVIITVPLGYLKKDLIKFTPQLSSDKKEAIEKLAFFSMNKLFVEFEEKFWPDDKDFLKFFMHPLAFYYACNFYKVNGKNLLIFFISEDNYNIDIRNKSNEELKLIIMERFKKVFPGKNVKITNILKTDWGNDNFTFGSFTELSGHEHLRRRFMTPEGRLFFAGEHTAPKFNAYVYGAYLSGLRAAKQILRDKNKK